MPKHIGFSDCRPIILRILLHNGDLDTLLPCKNILKVLRLGSDSYSISVKHKVSLTAKGKTKYRLLKRG